MLIDQLQPADIAHWIRMRRELGPSWFSDDMEAFSREYFTSGSIQGLPHRVLVARSDTSGEPIGFAEVSLREYAEGCTSSPVGYLEGWYVDEAHQGRGVGRALLRSCEQWAAEQGCTEIASDAEIENEPSIAAHEALGFEAVCSIVCFAKPIERTPEQH